MFDEIPTSSRYG